MSRKELVEYLKVGDYKIIQEKSGLHRSTINNWVKGESNNKVVEVLITALANKRKNELEQLTKNI